jgi:D-alanyl-D-alanine carboxypeptidase
MSTNFLDTNVTKHTSRIHWLPYFNGIVFLIIALAGVGFLWLGNISAPTLSFVETITPFTLEGTEVAYGGDLFIDPPVVEVPQFPVLVGEPFDMENISADSVIVKDAETGFVYAKKNEYTSHSTASVAKLMSALVLLEKGLDWKGTHQVVPGDYVDTHMYAGDTYTIEELWNAGLIASSNKAIMTLADSVGWDLETFVARMNEKAQELGMGDTLFVEPTGLDAGDVSTASDLVLLLEEALQHEEIQDVVLTSEYNLYSEERNKKHHMWNTNWLLLGWIPNDFTEFHGGKTGFIPAAGYNFVMKVEDDSGHVLDVVVLGADTHEARFTEARDIATWVFDAYTWPQDNDNEHE